MLCLRLLVTLAVALLLTGLDAATVDAQASEEAKKAAPALKDAAKRASELAGAAEPVKEFNPVPHLIRDPAVRDDLKLTALQTIELDQWLAIYSARLFPLRDATPVQGGREWNSAAADLETALDSVLSRDQRARLAQLKLQSRGLSGILTEELQAKLAITEEQHAKITKVFDDTKRKIAALRLVPADKQEETAAQLVELQQQMHRDVLMTLTTEQQTTLGQLVGKPLDMTRITPNAGRPPELRGIVTWFNSDPLTLASLRGKVTIVHFYSFNNQACAKNFPHYNRWAEEFPKDKVAVVALHVPETEQDRNLKELRAASKRDALTHPIGLDTLGQTAQAWNNGAIPSVYILDQKGDVRFWWYGPLDQAGASGSQQAEQVIRALVEAGSKLDNAEDSKK